MMKINFLADVDRIDIILTFFTATVTVEMAKMILHPGMKNITHRGNNDLNGSKSKCHHDRNLGDIERVLGKNKNKRHDGKEKY